MADKKRSVIRQKSGHQFSRNQISNFKKGDIINVKYVSTYDKWVTPYSKEEVSEIDYKRFILDRVKIESVI